MKKYILEYMEQIKSFIDEKLDSSNEASIRALLKEFETKISYFQHERLIHLIVTVLFAIMEIMALFMTVLVPSSLIPIIFMVMFLVLLVPYIMHYYFLENSVQEMYKLRDIIYEKLKFLSDNE